VLDGTAVDGAHPASSEPATRAGAQLEIPTLEEILVLPRAVQKLRPPRRRLP
jgi:hypothetical protein